ncbi:MAG: hypothetical protein ACRDS1_15630 [Pseudonocardiaceae bacterium]
MCRELDVSHISAAANVAAVEFMTRIIAARVVAAIWRNWSIHTADKCSVVAYED